MKLLLKLATVAFASASLRVEMERDVLFGQAPNWDREARAGAAESVNVILMLTHSDLQLAELESKFWAVSTPGHAEYGEHLTQAQVTKMVAAPAATVDKLTNWLTVSGATRVSVSEHQDAIEADLPASAAEAAFGTQIFRFRHRKHSSVSLLRASTRYTLPAELAGAVRYVANLARLPAVDGALVVAPEAPEGVGGWENGCGSKCSNFVTPGILAQRYQLGDAPAQPAKGSMAVAEFQGVDWDQQGLDTLAAACSLSNVTVDHQVGDNSQAKCKIPVLGLELCGEAMLDIEYIKGVAPGIPLTDVFNKEYSLENWAKQLEAMPDGTLPLVHSVSYGNDESQQTGDAFIQASNVEFQKLGVRGVSVLFASGDQGVAGRSGGGSRFHPDFPGGSPFITVVGGTDFATKNVVGEEKAWSDGGGGFSDHFAIPSYQADAVATYKTTAASSLPPQSYWNNTGRGYPDVAALGGQQNAYCVSVSKTLAGVAGTSAACPVVAGVFAKLNELRLAKGGKPLGFLNPFIYQNAAAFNDVTQGSNPGVQKGKGFPAVKGWDAATGVGTPNFAALAKVV
eukprot:g5366.t1